MTKPTDECQVRLAKVYSKFLKSERLPSELLKEAEAKRRLVIKELEAVEVIIAVYEDLLKGRNDQTNRRRDRTRDISSQNVSRWGLREGL